MDSLKIKNIRILRLKGTRYERARAHGELIASLSKSEKENLVYTPLSQKNQTLIKRAGARVPGFGKLVGGLYEALVLERFLRLPKEYRKRLAPFAKASKIPLKKIWLSLYQPDLLMVLAASGTESVRSHFLAGMPGCSTASALHNGEMYFLRNLDYPAASYWEKNTTVFYHEPSEPELQNYLTLSSLGIDTSGLTGVNESGIAFSLHAHFSKKVSLKGVPIFFLGEAILEKAKNIDQAIKLCQDFKPIGSWALNISSSKEKRSVSVELVKGKINVREEPKTCGLAHSNTFQAQDFKSDELHFSGAFFEDCEARKKSLEHSIKNLSQNFSWEQALSALASHTDITTGSDRIFGNTLSVVTTIQSVGFDLKENCVYVSTRGETPTGHGPYLKLPFSFDDIPLNDSPTLLALPERYSPEFMQALHLYYQAYVSWQVRGEAAALAHSYLIQATEALAHDPHLQMQRGYFELIAEQPGIALNCFHLALKEPLSAHLKQVALYFQGACFDLLGNREKAIQSYQEILSFTQADPKLRKKAKKRLNQPYQASYCKRIAPDLQFAEPIEYI